MKIGLIDVDGHNFPNLPLMKISAYHKQRGDSVEWYSPLVSGHCDKVYLSKVFSFTKDYEYYIDADVIERGGSGYSISLVDGKEVYDKSKDKLLPYEIEHIYPDYELYNIKETAYGFLTRGCPRGCDFCHVAAKEGQKAYKVANLNEFWHGQKKIVLLDPNILACKESEDLLQQLADSKALVDFTQGLDIRLMTESKAKLLNKIKVDRLHFAWDRYQDKKYIQPKFLEFRKISKVNQHNLHVYCLVGFDTTFEQDLERVYWLRDNGYSPYIMVYNKDKLTPKHKLLRLQRWVNNRFIFWSCKNFEDYGG